MAYKPRVVATTEGGTGLIAAGTSGNVLTSDGTNWASTAPASSSFVSGSLVGVQAGNPADATTYYFSNGQVFTNSISSSTTFNRFYITTTCTITKVYGAFKVASTLGTSENCTLFIRKNDTTNTNISTTIQLNATDVNFNNTGLSISLVAGDYIVFGFTGPSWVTNPISVSMALTFSS